MSIRLRLKLLGGLVATAAASDLAWSGCSAYALPLSLAMPFAVGLARTKRQALLVAAAYFAGALWPIIPSAQAFLGHRTSFGGIALFCLAVLLLASPFGLVGHLSSHTRWAAVGGLLLLEAATAFGLASPLTAAGVLFPASGFFGLACLLALCCALVARKRLPLGILCCLSLSMLSLKPVPAGSPLPWAARDTNLGGSGFSAASVWTRYQVLNDVSTAAFQSQDKVLIFPENMVKTWSDGISEAWMKPAFDELKFTGKTVLFGAEKQLPHHGYQAVMLARGASADQYVERFPVPVAMWGNGAPIHPLAKGTLRVGQVTAGVLICYEQLLVLPALQSFAQGAEVLVAPANLYWTKDTRVGAIQDASVKAWGSLFDVPTYRAVNE